MSDYYTSIVCSVKCFLKDAERFIAERTHLRCVGCGPVESSKKLYKVPTMIYKLRLLVVSLFSTVRGVA
jgi:hypothetical protein